MPDRTNYDRAMDARKALETFCDTTGLSLDPDDQETHTAIIDLMTDLMHFHNSREEIKLTFDDIIRIAYMHFHEERLEEGG